MTIQCGDCGVFVGNAQNKSYWPGHGMHVYCQKCTDPEVWAAKVKADLPEKEGNDGM